MHHVNNISSTPVYVGLQLLSVHLIFRRYQASVDQVGCMPLVVLLFLLIFLGNLCVFLFFFFEYFSISSYEGCWSKFIFFVCLFRWFIIPFFQTLLFFTVEIIGLLLLVIPLHFLHFYVFGFHSGYKLILMDEYVLLIFLLYCWYPFCNSYLPNPSARAGYDTRSIFKRSLTGLNSEFSFS